MPSTFKRLYFFWKQRRFWRLFKREPQEIFTEIYEHNIWGGEQGVFFSGTGSNDPRVEIYISNLAAFIQENQIKTITDLGCGDFSVMQKVLDRVDHQVEYIGIDIVKDLIDFNNSNYATERIRFQQANIIDDALPEGELVLVRQVLQHLSNAQISAILRKIAKYKWALLSEHLPIKGSIVFNVDKIPGPHIRMKMNSGVFIDKEPFNITNSRVLFEYRQDDPVKGKMVPAVIRTYLVFGCLDRHEI